MFFSLPGCPGIAAGRVKSKVKIAQFGLGPIGVACLKLAASCEWARVIGAIEIDPAKAGMDLGRLTGNSRLQGLRVVEDLDRLPVKPDLVFHTAVSRFRAAYPQLESMVRRGINVVSSCEELVFPMLQEHELAAKLDRLCVQYRARVVGTGVNPGFVMDLLPVCLTSVVARVKSIHIERVVDAATRRESLQRKIGSGLAPEEFRRLLKQARAGHAGLKESLALIAHALRWDLKNIRETGEAIVAKRNVRTRFLHVRKGETCGLHQRIEAFGHAQTQLTLDLKMYLEARDPHDVIRIEGDPPVKITIAGGIAGDQATIAALVNTAPRLLGAAPGLRLLTELPMTSWDGSAWKSSRHSSVARS